MEAWSSLPDRTELQVGGGRFRQLILHHFLQIFSPSLNSVFL